MQLVDTRLRIPAHGMKERPDAPACPSSVPLPHTAAHSQPPVAPGSDLGPGRPGRAGEVGCGRWAAREARQRCLLQLRATNTSSGRRSEPTGKAQQPDIERHYIKFFAHPDLAYIALRGSARHTWLQRTAPLRLAVVREARCSIAAAGGAAARAPADSEST